MNNNKIEVKLPDTAKVNSVWICDVLKQYRSHLCHCYQSIRPNMSDKVIGRENVEAPTVNE